MVIGYWFHVIAANCLLLAASHIYPLRAFLKKILFNILKKYLMSVMKTPFYMHNGESGRHCIDR